MADHDVHLLTLGIALGMNFMLLVHLVFGVLDDRRNRKAARAAEAKLAAAREKTAA